MRICAFVLVGWIAGAASVGAQALSAAEEGAAPPTLAGTTQSPAAPAITGYVPVTRDERIFWIVDGTIGPQSLAVGVVAAAWQTGWNVPDEWGRTWSGVGKRYLAREADVAISNTIEAGFGAMWGEDPRYIPAPRGTIRSRIGYAFKTVVFAPRRDGHLALAWGRFAGNTLNNVIENSYLPPSYTTPGQTIWRSASGLVSRLGYNLWEEFWPDIRRRLHH